MSVQVAAPPLARPQCPIPIDKTHAFFNVPLKTSDPAVRTWETWFRTTKVQYEKITLDGRTQLYLHRVQLKHSNTTIEQWCCSTQERRMKK
jgi:hypothetical protein